MTTTHTRNFITLLISHMERIENSIIINSPSCASEHKRMLSNTPWGKFTDKVEKREDDYIQNNPDIFPIHLI